MAAVAGSKGRIALERKFGTASIPFHADVAGQVLSGNLSCESAAALLLSRARLREVGVDTNMLCNLACSYCYLADRREERGSLPLDQAADFLSDCVDAGSKLVAFIGKEPLGDERALKLEKALRARSHDRSFRTGIVTNGTLIERHIDKLASSELNYLDVSIDGFAEVNDAVRGAGAYDKALAGLRLAIRHTTIADLAVTTVLSAVSRPAYFAFADEMLDQGVTTCFASPVLRFATSNSMDARKLALSGEDVASFIGEALRWANKRGLQHSDGRQILIDLPYKYSWMLLANGHLRASEVQEDNYEAHYWQPDSTIPVFVKLSFVPMSYWRAIRITHDGRIIANMDLAAHREYAAVSPKLDDVSNHWWSGSRAQDDGARILAEFFRSMLRSKIRTYEACERELEQQFAQMRMHQAA